MSGWRDIRESIELKLGCWPDSGETAILRRSAGLRSKEQAMHDKVSRRTEAALAKLGTRIDRAGYRLSGRPSPACRDQ